MPREKKQGEDEEVECPECSKSLNTYAVGTHFYHSECEPPRLTDRQKSIITGLLMGDASVNTRKQINTVMVTRPFLEWVDEELGFYSTGLYLHYEGEEQARRSFNSKNSILKQMPEKPKDTYRVSLRSIGEIKDYASWYDSGQKRFPENLQMNPLIARVWYCCDGGLGWAKRANEAVPTIGVNNEADREEYLLSLWEPTGIKPNLSGSILQFTGKDKKRFMNYLESPLPGFEYKWIWEDRERYYKAKERHDNGHSSEDLIINYQSALSW